MPSFFMPFNYILNEGAKGSVDGLVYVQKSGTNEAEFMPNGKYRLDDTRENQEKDSGLKADSNANKYDYRARPVGAIYPDGYNGRKPGVSLISLDKVPYSDGSYWRIAHNFDYYKDLPDASSVPEIPASTPDKKIRNWVESDVDYYIVEKDMIFVIKDDNGLREYPTINWNNQSIIDFKKQSYKVGHGYNISDDTIEEYKPVFRFDSTILFTQYTYKNEDYIYWKETQDISGTPSGYVYPVVGWGKVAPEIRKRNIIGQNQKIYKLEDLFSIGGFENTFGSNLRYATSLNNECSVKSYTLSEPFESKRVVSNITPNLHTPSGPGDSGYYWGTVTFNDYVHWWKSDGTIDYSYGTYRYSSSQTVTDMYDDVKIYGTFLFGKRRTYLFKCYETSDGNNKAGIEYKDSDTPYIITKSDLINNMNYVTPQLYVKHDFHRSDNGNYISESNDGGTDTIKPTLMHEHVVPCICPDSFISLPLRDKQTRSPVLYVP